MNTSTNFYKNNLANIFTCFNLFSGCIALHYATMGIFHASFYWLIVALLFDFIDGFAARATNTTSNIGKDLDSLADMVSFGVVPGYLVVSIIAYNNREMLSQGTKGFMLPELIGFLITIFSAVRLANFNNDTRQTESFIGMPTPANGIFIASLAMQYNSNTWLAAALHNNMVLLGITILCSFWLLMEMPLLALKFKNFLWQENKLKYILIFISVLLIAIFNIQAIPLIIIIYLSLSVINSYFFK